MHVERKPPAAITLTVDAFSLPQYEKWEGKCISCISIRYPTSHVKSIIHFVFWLDFGGMKPEIVCQSMQLLAQEVIPHIKAEMAGTELTYS